MCCTESSHRVVYEYNEDNNVSSITETVNGTTKTYSYTYDDDNRLISENADGITVTYTYDDLGRLTQKQTKNGDTVIKTDSYTFTASTVGTNGTSSQVAGYNGLSYTYDDNGNIQTVSDGTNTTSYFYDSANQLVCEKNQALGVAKVWTYDSAGNITSRKEYAFSDYALQNPLDTVVYEYNDADWGDKLTSYDGRTFEYDSVGNLTDDEEWEYAWQHGRQLASMSNGTTTWTYTYDANGMRTKRTNGTNTYEYVYDGSQLVQLTIETTGDYSLEFTYDASGTPLTVTANGYLYYYVTNLQGDVIGIKNSSGEQVVTYLYDAWGNVTATGTDPIRDLNPLLYRSYVFDWETNLYYLQSRYYNPEWGRFINADGFVTTGFGFVGNNMHAYCNNNPLLYKDLAGFVIVLDPDSTEEQIEEYERAIAYLLQSKTASELIQLLEASSEIFTIKFANTLEIQYNYETNTITINPKLGLLVGDGVSGQSVAMALAHEMGHAAQDHLQVRERLLDVYTGDNELVKDELERLNLAAYETPIARELGEPTRRYYEDTRGYWVVNNSTHHRVKITFWQRLTTWNWNWEVNYLEYSAN